MSEPALRPATPDDTPAIVALLQAAHLPAAELELHLDHFVVGESDGRIVACGGLEAFPEAKAGLVRSMAVEEPLRGQDIGSRVLSWVEEHAESLGITELFLFTVGARDFYLRFGYRDATLDEFPEALRQSFQYRFVREHGTEWKIRAMRKRAGAAHPSPDSPRASHSLPKGESRTAQS